MTTDHVIRSVLLTTGVLLMAACASQPASPSLLEKKFQQEASRYDKFQHEGQVIYCKKPSPRSLPHTQCISEPQLRLQVEKFERSRNQVQRGGPPVVSTGPGG